MGRRPGDRNSAASSQRLPLTKRPQRTLLRERCVRFGEVTTLLLLGLRGARIWRRTGRVGLRKRRAAAARLRRSQRAAGARIIRRDEGAARGPGRRRRVQSLRRLAGHGFTQLIAAAAGRERKKTDYG